MRAIPKHTGQPPRRTYVADMAVYMPYLQRWCKRLGVKFWQQQVASMAEAVAMARAQAGSQGGWCNVAVVNCTGVGARQLCNDARVCMMQMGQDCLQLYN